MFSPEWVGRDHCRVTAVSPTSVARKLLGCEGTPENSTVKERKRMLLNAGWKKNTQTNTILCNFIVLPCARACVEKLAIANTPNQQPNWSKYCGCHPSVIQRGGSTTALLSSTLHRTKSTRKQNDRPMMVVYRANGKLPQTSWEGRAQMSVGCERGVKTFGCNLHMHKHVVWMFDRKQFNYIQIITGVDDNRKSCYT